MKTVLMNSTEQMATSKGPQTLQKGKTYPVEDWIADSMIGRGFASLVVETEVSGEIGVVAAAFTLDDLLEKNVAELRDLAKAHGIEGWKTLKKAELLDALGALAVSPVPDAPPPTPFEPFAITGGETPPEFKREE